MDNYSAAKDSLAMLHNLVNASGETTPVSELEQVKSERDALAQAIGEFVVAVGIARDVPLTGPELLHMLQSAQGFLTPDPGPVPAEILAELVESICKDKQGKFFIPESEYPVVAKATAYVENSHTDPVPQDPEHGGVKFNGEFFVSCASEHGLNSDDPDHEVGDLQEFFRLSWSLLTTQQRDMFVRNSTVLDLVECSDQDRFQALEAYQEETKK